MRVPGPIVLVTALLLLGVAPRGSRANGDAFVVIVNPETGSATIDRGFLRDAFLRKATTWGGVTLRPIDLSTRHAARERFTRDVLKKTPAQLRSYWNQQIFSGKGVPPPEVESPAAVVKFVSATKGAVGYVPAGTDTNGAKVIGVR
jgi:ABC-type phosphate transport system substrate-binding protein